MEIYIFKKTLMSIGLMSGTSMDGIDATILETDGKKFLRTEYNITSQYNSETIDLLKVAISKPMKFMDDNNQVKKLNLLITHAHAIIANQITSKFLEKSEVKPDIIGFHGQTIYHNPNQKISLQLGDAALLSKLTGIDVVSDLRKLDMIKGGEGAPLAPIYHASILNNLGNTFPSAILNLGGVANITWFDGQNLIGFDTGPANGLIDIFMQKKFSKPYDFNGEIASRGIPNIKLVDKIIKDPFFVKQYPKSLDRLTFKKIFKDKEFLNLSDNDAVATLTQLTITSIIMSLDLLPKYPQSLIIVGGGENNSHIINNLKKRLNCNVIRAKDINLPGHMVEAELIAFLAVRSLKGLPITFPNTTGIKIPSIGGKLYISNSNH